MNKLEVGQTLWLVPRERGEPREVTVKKIGRKWAKVNGGMRIDIETLAVDGGEYSSPAQCYLSQEDHESHIDRTEAWVDLRRVLGGIYSAPAHLTGDDIREIIAKVQG